jgi:hypothetical protein
VDIWYIEEARRILAEAILLRISGDSEGEGK